MAHYEEIVREKGERTIPVVSMSGSIVESQEAMYHEYRMHAFLEKPIARRLLFDVILSVK